MEIKKFDRYAVAADEDFEPDSNNEVCNSSPPHFLNELLHNESRAALGNGPSAMARLAPLACALLVT